MTPQLAFRHPTTESDLILSNFLHELDELDCFQDFSHEFIDSKLRQGLHVAPEPVNIPKKRRSTSWLRRKEELTSLRSESEMLETRLTFLRMEIDRRASFQQSIPTASEASGMWQSVALIARQECETSQNENEKLKNEVQMYARAAEMLQRQLADAEARRQQLLSSELMIEGRLSGLLPTTSALNFTNEEVLDMLEKRIDARFHELAWIMHEAHRPAQGGTSVQICREENHPAAAVEFRHVRLLPFGEDTMATSIWEIIGLGGVVTRTNTKVVRITSDRVAMVSRHSIPFGCNASVNVDVHSVIKRFAVSTGMVALIESHSEWSIKYPSSEVLRSTTEEGGWVVVHEYPLKSSSDANQRASQLKTSVKLRPKEPQGGNSSSLTSTIVDVVVPSFRDILSSHHQTVENFLLDSNHTLPSRSNATCHNQIPDGAGIWRNGRHQRKTKPSALITFRLAGMENRRAQDMAPLLETSISPLFLNAIDSDFVLSEFLQEMDELERLQTPKQKVTESKRQRGLGVEIEPVLKKIKTSKQDQHQASTKPKRRSTSWLRRKQELQTLRCEYEALETQVTFLQLQHEHKAAKPFPEVLTEGQEMWKSVAEIARGEYQNSQSENARLKTELQTCAWAFEKLHTQLVQASSQHEKQFSSKTSFENAMRVGIIMSRRLHSGTNEIFDKLQGKLATRFFELDGIVRAAYESALEGATEQVRVCRKDGREAAAAVEFKHARLLPFAQDTTADIIWEIIELGGVTRDKHFCVTRRSNDVVCMSSRFMIPLDRSNNNTVNVDVHAVVKRFAAPIGMVVLVESSSEWSVDYPASAAWKQTTEEEGYVLVNELPYQSNDTTPQTCHVQTNMKLRVNEEGFGDCGSARPTFTGNVRDIVIPSFREILSSHHQSVENFLLDSSQTIRA